jgi:hypothetical protein
MEMPMMDELTRLKELRDQRVAADAEKAREEAEDAKRKEAEAERHQAMVKRTRQEIFDRLSTFKGQPLDMGRKVAVRMDYQTGDTILEADTYGGISQTSSPEQIVWVNFDGKFRVAIIPRDRAYQSSRPAKIGSRHSFGTMEELVEVVISELAKR